MRVLVPAAATSSFIFRMHKTGTKPNKVFKMVTVRQTFVHLIDHGSVTGDTIRTRGAYLQLHVVNCGCPHANHTSAVVREQKAVGRYEPREARAYIACYKETKCYDGILSRFCQQLQAHILSAVLVIKWEWQRLFSFLLKQETHTFVFVPGRINRHINIYYGWKLKITTTLQWFQIANQNWGNLPHTGLHRPYIETRSNMWTHRKVWATRLHLKDCKSLSLLGGREALCLEDSKRILLGASPELCTFNIQVTIKRS